MQFTIYSRRGTVYIPTIAKLDTGAYLAVEPVETAGSADLPEVQRAFARCLARGNPPMISPSGGRFPKSVVASRAGAGSWSEFIKGAHAWQVRIGLGRAEIAMLRADPEGGLASDHATAVALSGVANAEELASQVARIVCGL